MCSSPPCLVFGLGLLEHRLCLALRGGEHDITTGAAVDAAATAASSMSLGKEAGAYGRLRRAGMGSATPYKVDACLLHGSLGYPTYFGLDGTGLKTAKYLVKMSFRSGGIKCNVVACTGEA